MTAKVHEPDLNQLSYLSLPQPPLQIQHQRLSAQDMRRVRMFVALETRLLERDEGLVEDVFPMIVVRGGRGEKRRTGEAEELRHGNVDKEVEGEEGEGVADHGWC